jgi:hypothetical protein
MPQPLEDNLDDVIAGLPDPEAANRGTSAPPGDDLDTMIGALPDPEISGDGADSEPPDAETAVGTALSLAPQRRRSNQDIAMGDALGVDVVGEELEAYEDTTSFGERQVARLRSGFKGLKQGREAQEMIDVGRQVQALDQLREGATEDELFEQDPQLWKAAKLGGYLEASPDELEERRQQIANELRSSAREVVALQQEMEDLPSNPVAERLARAEDFGTVWELFKKDPAGVVAQLGLESLPRSIPSLVAGAAGTAAGGPGLGATAAGGASMGQEYGNRFLEALGRFGVDTSSPEALDKALRNQTLVSAAHQQALKGSAAVGAFDAASFGLAGRTPGTSGIKNRLARTAVDAGTQTTAQGALGAAGEAAAQQVTTGEVQPGQVAAEFVGEFIGAPGEVLSARGANFQAEDADVATRIQQAARGEFADTGTDGRSATEIEDEVLAATDEELAQMYDEAVQQEPSEERGTRLGAITAEMDRRMQDEGVQTEAPERLPVPAETSTETTETTEATDPQQEDETADPAPEEAPADERDTLTRYIEEQFAGLDAPQADPAEVEQEARTYIEQQFEGQPAPVQSRAGGQRQRTREAETNERTDQDAGPDGRTDVDESQVGPERAQQDVERASPAVAPEAAQSEADVDVRRTETRPEAQVGEAVQRAEERRASAARDVQTARTELEDVLEEATPEELAQIREETGSETVERAVRAEEERRGEQATMFPEEAPEDAENSGETGAQQEALFAPDEGRNVSRAVEGAVQQVEQAEAGLRERERELLQRRQREADARRQARESQQELDIEENQTVRAQTQRAQPEPEQAGQDTEPETAPRTPDVRDQPEVDVTPERVRQEIRDQYQQGGDRSEQLSPQETERVATARRRLRASDANTDALEASIQDATRDVARQRYAEERGHQRADPERRRQAEARLERLERQAQAVERADRAQETLQEASVPADVDDATLQERVTTAREAVATEQSPREAFEARRQLDTAIADVEAATGQTVGENPELPVQTVQDERYGVDPRGGTDGASIEVVNLETGRTVDARSSNFEPAVAEYVANNADALETRGRAVHDTAPEGERLRVDQYLDRVARESSNPLEIAEAAAVARESEAISAVQDQDNLVSEVLDGPRISTRSFDRVSDPNFRQDSPELQLNWLSRGGKALDTYAQELSDELGREVTEQEIVDVVMEYPRRRRVREAPEVETLRDRFYDVTGVRLTDSLLDEILERQYNPDTSPETASTDAETQSRQDPDRRRESGRAPERVDTPQQAPFQRRARRGRRDGDEQRGERRVDGRDGRTSEDAVLPRGRDRDQQQAQPPGEDRGGDSVEQTVRRVAAETADSLGLPRVPVVPTAEALPGPVRLVYDFWRQRIGPEFEQTAMFFDGQVYLVADSLQRAAEDAGIPLEDFVRRAYMHEVVAHQGLPGLLGDQYTPLLSDVYDALGEDVFRERGLFDAYADQIERAEDGTLTEESKALLVDEFAADVAEDVNLEPTLWERLVEAIQRAISRVMGSVSEADIRLLLRASADHLRGQRAGVPVRATRFLLAGERAEGFQQAEDEGDVFIGPFDEQPRFEISDREASIVGLDDNQTPIGKHFSGREDLTLSDVLDHRELYANYPDAADIPVEIRSGIRENGQYYREEDRIVLHRRLVRSEALDTLVHEIQHAIQNREGFARGTGVQAEKQRVRSDLEVARSEFEILESLREAYDLARMLTGQHPAFEGREMTLDEANEAHLDGSFPEQAIDQVDRLGAESVINQYESTRDQLENLGFAPRNPYRRRLLRGESDLGPDQIDDRARTRYRQSAGEIEAREVEARRSLSDRNRARRRPFFDASGEPIATADDVIVRFQRVHEDGRVNVASGNVRFSRSRANESDGSDGDRSEPIGDPETRERIRQQFQERLEQARELDEGEERPGRPELANPASDEDVREAVDVVDETRKPDEDEDFEGRPEQQSFEQWREEADRMLEEDYEGTKARLLNGDMQGPADVMAAKRIINEEGLEALAGTDEDIMDFALMVNAYREQRSDQARTLAAGRDPEKTPAERRREHLVEAVVMPSDETARRLQKAETDAERRRILEEHAGEVQHIKDILDEMGLDPTQMTEEELNDPVTVAQAIRTVRQTEARAGDKLYEYWINAILSAPTTQAANIIGNSVNASWEFIIQRPMEAVVNEMITAVRGDPGTGARLGELPEVWKGLLGGTLKDAWRNAALAWETEAPIFAEEMGYSGKQTKLEERTGSIEGTTGRVVRIPGRLLVAADEMFKTVFWNLQVGAEAYRIAKREGLEGQALTDRIQQLRNNPDSEAGQRAFDKALELTFQEETGISDVLSGVRRDVPALKYILPFVRTPTNIIRAGVRKSPFGSARILWKAMRQGLYTLGATNDPANVYRQKEFARDAAEQVLAWGSVWGLWALTEGVAEDDDREPFVTGTSASFNEEGERRFEYRAYPSMSIRIGDTWYSYARIEPMSTQLALAIDLINEVRAAEQGKPTEDALGSAWGRLLDLAKEKTFLKGIGDIVRAIEYESSALGMAQDFVTSWTPNLLRKAARSSDDFFRDTEARGEGRQFAGELLRRTVQQALPAPEVQDLVGDVPPPRVDVWGRESRRYGRARAAPYTTWLYRMTVPVWRQEADRATELDRLLLNWNNQNPNDGFYPTPPEATFSRRGQTIRMTADEYYSFLTRSGRLAYQRLLGMDLNVQEPTEADIEKIEYVLRRTRDQVKSRMIRKGEIADFEQTFGKDASGDDRSRANTSESQRSRASDLLLQE